MAPTIARFSQHSCDNFEHRSGCFLTCSNIIEWAYGGGFPMSPLGVIKVFVEKKWKTPRRLYRHDLCSSSRKPNSSLSLLKQNRGSSSSYFYVPWPLSILLDHIIHPSRTVPKSNIGPYHVNTSFDLWPRIPVSLLLLHANSNETKPGQRSSNYANQLIPYGDKELIIVSFRMTVSLALFLPSSLRLRVILNGKVKFGEPPSVVFVGFHTPSSLNKES